MVKSGLLKKIAFALLGALILAFFIKEAGQNGDFKVFLEASKMAQAGENPYNFWIRVSENSTALYFYSPLWIAVLIPFTYLPQFITNFIWLLANAFFLYRVVTILKNFIRLDHLSIKQQRWLFVLTVAMSIRFVLYNFEMLQMTIFLLWGMLESLKLFDEKKILTGSALLAFVINVKLLPLVMIPYLLYRSRFRAAGSTLVLAVAFLFLPAIVWGWSKNLFLLDQWWSVINPTNAEHLLETELGEHSLAALIPLLLTEAKGILEYQRNILNLSPEVAIGVLNMVRAALILLTVYFLTWPPFREAQSNLHKFRELSFLVLLIPLIFPHQQKYAYFLVLPAAMYISYFLVVSYPFKTSDENKPQWYIIAILAGISFLLMTLTTDGVVGRTFNKITQHYRLITYGALFMLAALTFCTPGKIKQENPN